MRQIIELDGLTPDDFLAMSDEELDGLVFVGPVCFRAGSAEVLGEFSVQPGRLTIILAQIDGGGEGVLLTLWLLARRFARARGIAEVAWIIHAVTCSDPNRKLQRVLDKRGFVVEVLPDHGPVYHLLDRP